MWRRWNPSAHRDTLHRQRPSDLSVAERARRLYWAWALHAGLVAFGVVWLWQRGVWWALVKGDTTGISAGIVVLSLGVTLWCGQRLSTLAREAGDQGRWRQAYQDDRQQGLEQAADLLSERAHGPHETAWWLAAAAIKLGLLGTVIGFILMSMSIGQMPSFDLERVQDLLKGMTQGMAIALYTTLVGLVANLWLGLQLLCMDRLADHLVADILTTTPATPR